GPAHEVVRGSKDSVIILGSGPNRIGQGIEFDYCCVHAAMTVRQRGRDAVMVNCNPETVSTDYDTSDRLYFEPLTLEDVLGICEVEKPDGVIVQFGGQTPLKLAAGLERAGVHSGDSACALPPHSLGDAMLTRIREQTAGIALGLGVVGLLNVQFAVLGDDLYVIEANPRASRTVPFVSKATGVALAKLA